METAKWSYYEKVNKFGEVCFWTALILEFTFVMLDKSMYIIQYEFYWFCLTTFLFGCKVLTTKYNWKEWLLMVGLLLVGFFVYIRAGRYDVVRIVVMSAACKNIDLKKVWKLCLVITGVGTLIIMILSFFGIGYPVYSTELYRGGGVEETRFFFGMGHPNAFHCMFFLILLLLMLLYLEKTRWYYFVFAAVLNLVIYLFTDSNYGFISSMLLIVVACLYRYLPKLRNCKWVYYLMIPITLLIFLLNYLSVFYVLRVEDHFWKWIDRHIMNGRMSVAAMSCGFASGQSFWKIFSEPGFQDYFDMGILRIVYWYGKIPFAIFMLLVVLTLYISGKKNDYQIMILIMILLTYTTFEAHFVSSYLGRNLMLFVWGSFTFPYLLRDRKSMQENKN